MSGAPDGKPSARAARWLARGLFDAEFYGALRGRRFTSAAEAAEDFVTTGLGLRLSPHPFLDVATLPPETKRAWRRRRVDDVLDRLTGPDGQMEPQGPLASCAHPVAARAAMIMIARMLAAEDVSTEPGDPDWYAPRAPRSGVTSVVVDATDHGPALRALRSLLRHQEDRDLEVWLVDRGSPPHVSLALHAASVERPEVHVLRLPKATSAARGIDLAMARATGDVVVLLDAETEVRRGWLAAARAPLSDANVAGVQPLLLQPDDSIETAGPGALLRGHPKEDARRIEGRVLPTVSPAAIVVRTADVVAVRGLGDGTDPDDSCLQLQARIAELRPGGYRVAASSWVTHHVDQRAVERPSAAPGDTHRLVAGRGWRWTLNLPSTPGWWGDDWGDTHFADALAEALRSRGHDVVTRRRGAHDSGPTHLDDIALALRGMHRAMPRPGRFNVLWVISHPDQVTVEELDGFDLVLAASNQWSADMSVRSGHEVVPLLQASAFAPSAATQTQKPDSCGVIFVGNNPADRERPLVRCAVEAGVPLTVYGRGWEDLPDGVWKGEYVANDRLPDLYRRHGIVLADHWPAMARHGFIANRVFDAVASGARVICDDVAGVHDVFDPTQVLVARNAQQVGTAFDSLREARTGVREPSSSLSFEDRAQALESLVLGRIQSVVSGEKG